MNVNMHFALSKLMVFRVKLMAGFPHIAINIMPINQIEVKLTHFIFYKPNC